QLTGRQATTRLQEEQDVDQSTGAHLPISIARLLTVHVRKRPIAPQASQWRRELKRRPNRGRPCARPNAADCAVGPARLSLGSRETARAARFQAMRRTVVLSIVMPGAACPVRQTTRDPDVSTYPPTRT